MNCSIKLFKSDQGKLQEIILKVEITAHIGYGKLEIDFFCNLHKNKP